MALTRTDSAEQREAILLGLLARNRIVSALRIIVPAAGVAAFLVLVVQIYAASALRQYGVSGIRIDRGALVVDTPDYAGVSKDGARYEARAREARAPLGTPSQIVMHDAGFDFTPAHGAAMHLTAPEATADTERQTLTVPGLATLRGDDGIHGTLTDLVADFQTGMTTGAGPVDLTYSNGTTLQAASFSHDGTANLWTFAHVTLTYPGLPEAAP
jgi:hypothetical protein